MLTYLLIIVCLINVIEVKALFSNYLIERNYKEEFLAQQTVVEYTIYVDPPPKPNIRVRAVYKNLKPPIILNLGIRDYSSSLKQLKNLTLYDEVGTHLKWKRINQTTLTVCVQRSSSVIASYSIDLEMLSERSTKVSLIGGTASGYDIFLTPAERVDIIKVRWILPEPWRVVSIYPKIGDWFIIQPINFEDIILEAKVSGWYYGNILFNYTKEYEDGFKIRVVAFKYSPLGFWNTYMNKTPLEKALEIADITYKIYKRIRKIFGGFPFKEIMLVGPDYWQAGATYAVFSLMGQQRYNEISHALIHAYESFYPRRIVFSGISYNLLREGLPTFAEAFITAEALNQSFWKGLAYERMIHYLRGKKFGTTYNQYVNGLIFTYILDQKIRDLTNKTRSLYDLLNSLWKKYNAPKPKFVHDDDIIAILNEIIRYNWKSFFQKYGPFANNIPEHEIRYYMKQLKEYFKEYLEMLTFVKYNGYTSMYFIDQELTAASGKFNFNYGFMRSENLIYFAIYAKNYKNLSKYNLTEEEIEEIEEEEEIKLVELVVVEFEWYGRTEYCKKPGHHIVTECRVTGYFECLSDYFYDNEDSIRDRLSEHLWRGYSRFLAEDYVLVAEDTDEGFSRFDVTRIRRKYDVNALSGSITSVSFYRSNVCGEPVRRLSYYDSMLESWIEEEFDEFLDWLEGGCGIGVWAHSIS